MKGRKLVTVLVAFLMMFSFATTAMAAEATPKEVKKIYLKVSQNSSGEINTILPTSGHGDEYDVSYVSQNYSAGENPVVTVTVTAKEGYTFYNDFTSKSQFSITGGKFWDGWRVDNSHVKVEIECSKITKGKLDTPTGLSWDEDYGLASWDEVYDADYYIVRINGNDLTVNDNIVNLRAYLKDRKNNTFRVRACSESSYLTDSSWSAISDELYYDSRDWHDYDGYYDDYYNYYDDYYYPPSYPSYSGSNSWVKRDGIWYYYDSNHRLLTNGMYQINGQYYLFDSQGKMLKGRQSWNGSKYFFYESSTGNNVEGARASGWVLYNSKWYYYDQYSGKEVQNQAVGGYYVGTNGMVTNQWQGNRYIDPNGMITKNAWQYISRGTWGKDWYYFDGNGNVVENQIRLINGLPYPFDATGKLKYGWFDYMGYSYYIKSDGNVARNEWIEGYYVDNYGRWIY